MGTYIRLHMQKSLLSITIWKKELSAQNRRLTYGKLYETDLLIKICWFKFWALCSSWIRYNMYMLIYKVMEDCFRNDVLNSSKLKWFCMFSQRSITLCKPNCFYKTANNSRTPHLLRALRVLFHFIFKVLFHCLKCNIWVFDWHYEMDKVYPYWIKVISK